MKDKSFDLDGVQITHPDKIIFPEIKVTKLDVARYYESVMDLMMPHLKDRPVSLVRAPEGLAGTEPAIFFQRHPQENFPEYIDRVKIKEKTGTIDTYISIDEPRDVYFLVNLGVLEFHVWGCKTGELDEPDLLVFDIDPDPSAEWKYAIEAAFKLKAELEGQGLKPFVKTSGGKGLHILTSLKGFGNKMNWDELKNFTHEIADKLVSEDPRHYVSQALKSKRKGKIFIDYLRNSKGASNVVAYSIRARSGAPVSMPVLWDEVDESLKPDKYSIKNALDSIHKREKDPWKEFS